MRAALLPLLAALAFAGCAAPEESGTGQQGDATRDTDAADGFPAPVGDGIGGQEATRGIGPLRVAPDAPYRAVYSFVGTGERAELLLVATNEGDAEANLTARLEGSQIGRGVEETLRLVPGQEGSLRLVLQGELEGQSDDIELGVDITSSAPIVVSGTLYLDRP